VICILLAVESELLRGACREIFHGAGYAVVEIKHGIDLLTAVRLLRCEAVCVDESQLGADALIVIHGVESPVSVIYIGDRPPEEVIALRPPVAGDCLLAAVNRAIPSLADPAAHSEEFALDRERRIAHSNGREVWLTRTQARLLALLIDRQPAPVATLDILREVWGFDGSDGDAELVRTHVRHLRQKLTEIGLGEAIRSQRGRGYRLAI